MPELLTDEEFLRYGRQILLPEIGEVGQARLKKSKVLIVGLGGLGGHLDRQLIGCMEIGRAHV